MRISRKQSEAALRYQERRQREDDAPRLCKEIPDLVRLTLDVEELARGGGGTQQKYVRRIVVENAPALFLLSCSDPRCTDGGHDVTTPIMHALRTHQTLFEGEHDCNGNLGPSVCPRVLRYKGTAEYQPGRI